MDTKVNHGNRLMVLSGGKAGHRVCWAHGWAWCSPQTPTESLLWAKLCSQCWGWGSKPDTVPAVKRQLHNHVEKVTRINLRRRDICEHHEHVVLSHILLLTDVLLCGGLLYSWLINPETFYRFSCYYQKYLVVTILSGGLLGKKCPQSTG